MLAERARVLTELGLTRLRYHGPGTDLEVGLSPGTVFVGGRRRDAYGHLISANVPTEECYTSPQAGAAAGTFRCSLPLSFRGRLIEGIAGEFRSGRLVRLEADTDADRDFLAAFLDSEPNARRLGEVALVDAQLADRAAQAGLLQHPARRERGCPHRLWRRLRPHAPSGRPARRQPRATSTST